MDSSQDLELLGKLAEMATIGLGAPVAPVVGVVEAIEALKSLDSATKGGDPTQTHQVRVKSSLSALILDIVNLVMHHR